MCDYLKSLQQFSFHSEVTEDQVYLDGKKLQYGIDMETYVKRPDKLRVNAVGDLVNKQFFFDGKTITLYDKDEKVYGAIDVPPNIEEALDKAHKDFGLRVALTDLASPQLWDHVSRKIEHSLYVGVHKVRGVPCHHLAFDGSDVHLQVWIDAGKEAIAAQSRVPPKETGRLSPMDRVSERLENSSTSGGCSVQIYSAHGGPENQVRSGEATACSWGRKRRQVMKQSSFKFLITAILAAALVGSPFLLDQADARGFGGGGASTEEEEASTEEAVEASTEEEATIVPVGLAAAAFVGAEVKVTMGAESAVAASVMVVDMPPVRMEGESQKARVEALLLKARGSRVRSC